MKKSIVAVLMVFGMVSICEAELLNVTGLGSDQASACSDAKFKTKDIAAMRAEEIVQWGQCQCSYNKNSETNKAWACSLDYRTKKY